MPRINTSRAKQVDVSIFDYDNIPISATYQSDGTPINLTGYKFEFFLKNDNTDVKEYTIDAGATSADFLTKSGVGVNVLEMKLMWEDIRDVINTKVYQGYKLIQVVTNTDSEKYVYIVFNINSSNYGN